MGWGDAASWITAIAALAALAGGYIQFVLKPSLLPSAEFDVQFVPLFRDGLHLNGEVAIAVKNLGSNTLVVRNVRYRLRYLADGAAPEERPRLSEPQFEKVPPPQGAELFVDVLPVRDDTTLVPELRVQERDSTSSSATQATAPSATSATRQRHWFLILGQRTFIQPGVTQHYRKPVTLPLGTHVVDVVAAFDYVIKLRRFRRFLVKLSDPSVGLIDWTHGVSNHTVRRTTHVPLVLPP